MDLQNTIQILENSLHRKIPVKNSNCLRLFHGRTLQTTALKDLAIDQYNDVIVLRFYKKPSEGFMNQLFFLVQSIYPDNHITYQYRFGGNSSIQAFPGTCVPESTIISEHGQLYLVQFNRGQNTGFFPDMRNARKWVIDYCRMHPGIAVLNLFAYTCSFSVAAIASGADRTVNIDMKKNSLIWGRENHRLNKLDQRRVRYSSINIMKSFNKIKSFGPFDLIICDPPSFQGSSFSYKSDYPKLFRKLKDWGNGNTTYLTALNYPGEKLSFLQNLARQNNLNPIESLPMTQDFSEDNSDEGLKILITED